MGRFCGLIKAFLPDVGRFLVRPRAVWVNDSAVVWRVWRQVKFGFDRVATRSEACDYTVERPKVCAFYRLTYANHYK